MVQIFVRSLDSRSHAYEVDPASEVATLKALIQVRLAAFMMLSQRPCNEWGRDP